DPDAVAAHDNRNFFAIGGQHGRTHRFGILRAEFEDVTNLHALENFERAIVTAWTSLARTYCSEVSPLIDFDIAFDVDATNVMVVFVGAGGHVATALETLVGNYHEVLLRRARGLFRSNSTKTARTRAQQFANLFRMSRADGARPQSISKFHFVQWMIPAQQGQHWPCLAFDRGGINE